MVHDATELVLRTCACSEWFHSNIPADGAKRLEDEKTLSSYTGIESGSMLLLLILPPFELYVQGADGRMHTITVPSSEPEVGLELCV